MKTVLRLADKIKYEAYFFALLMFTAFVSVANFQLPVIYPLNYSMYLLDYSFGFCARFLPGQIYRWISGGNYEYDAVQNYLRAEVVVALFLVAVVLGWFVKSAPEKSRKWYLLVATFYAAGPATFAFITYGMGTIDTMWIIFTPMFLIMLKNKYMKYLAPLWVIPIVLVHFSAITCYMILIFFALLYLASVRERKQDKAIYSTLFIVCFVVSISLSLYLAVFEGVNIKYSVEETLRRVMERSAIGDQTDLLYVEFDIFKLTNRLKAFNAFGLDGDVRYPYDSLKDDILIPAGSSVPPIIAKFLNAAWPNFHYHMSYYASQDAVPMEVWGSLSVYIFTFPLFVFIIRFWRHRIRIAKAENNKFQRLLFTAMIVYMPVFIVFWFCFSVDFFRYINHLLIVEGFGMLLVMRYNPGDSTKWIKERFGSYDKRLLILYSSMYFLIGNLVL